ncbi:hypothetical protein FRC08_015775, partial [Ceratobasidium sp. 394]
NAPAPNSNAGRSARQDPAQRSRSKVASTSRALAAPAPFSKRDNRRVNKVVANKRRKRVREESSDGEEKEGAPVHNVTKKVGKSARNVRSVVSSRENSTAPTPAPKCKADAMSAAPEPLTQEIQEPPAKKWKVMPKMYPPESHA